MILLTGRVTQNVSYSTVNEINYHGKVSTDLITTNTTLRTHPTLLSPWHPSPLSTKIEDSGYDLRLTPVSGPHPKPPTLHRLSHTTMLYNKKVVNYVSNKEKFLLSHPWTTPFCALHSISAFPISCYWTEFLKLELLALGVMWLGFRIQLSQMIRNTLRVLTSK